MRRFLPIEARSGVVRRRWSWPKGTRAPLSPRELEALQAASRAGERADPLEQLTAAGYLALSGLAIEAAYPELRGLPPLEQRERKADSRHGGLLDLPPEDSGVFYEWFRSRSWSGSHPWEIVFGHPHGILLYPMLDELRGWRLSLSVDCLGLYLQAVRMTTALGSRGVPVVLHAKEAVVAALRGLDEVEVGPGYGRLSVEELRERRPDGVARVRWDALPEIRPISPLERRRVQHVLVTGTPSGWPPSSTAGATCGLQTA